MTLAKNSWIRAFASSPLCRKAIRGLFSHVAHRHLEKPNFFLTQIERSEPEAVCWRSSGHLSNLEDKCKRTWHKCVIMLTEVSQETRFLVLHINVGEAMLSNHLRYFSTVRKGKLAPIFLKEVFVASRGTREAFSGPLHPSQVSRERKHHYFKRHVDKNDIICQQETHGKVFFFTSPAGTSRRISNVWQFHPG